MMCACILIHFDHTVDLWHKPETCKESDGSCEQEENKDNHCSVSKVEECGGEALHLQLGEEVVDAVDEEVDGREAWGQERPPPPVVILRTKVEIAQENSGLTAGDDQDDEHQEQEAKHVVGLVGPNTVQNEEKLNKNTSKWQNSSHNNTRQWTGV